MCFFSILNATAAKRTCNRHTIAQHSMEKHYKIINGKRESSEGKEKTEQKLRPTMNEQKKIAYIIRKTQQIVYEKSGVHSRCLCMVAAKTAAEPTCIRFHANIIVMGSLVIVVVVLVFFFFTQSRAAPSFSVCTLSCFDRQHTDRHHFSRALFFSLLLFSRSCRCWCCLWSAYFLFRFGGVWIPKPTHTQSSISCVLANDKDTTDSASCVVSAQNLFKTSS